MPPQTYHFPFTRTVISVVIGLIVYDLLTLVVTALVTVITNFVIG